MREKRVVFRYSEAFKRKVVGDLESGVFGSVAEAGHHYGIRGSTTVRQWVRRLGKNHLLCKVVRVETFDEKRQIEALRRQVRDLEHALAQTHMKELIAVAQFEVLCERQGIADVAGEKKKAAAELSRRRATPPDLRGKQPDLCGGKPPDLPERRPGAAAKAMGGK